MTDTAEETGAGGAGGPAPTLAEATATLTAPGQMFEIEELTIQIGRASCWGRV